MTTTKSLTLWQAICIITGYGVGSGIMALPYLVEKTGIVWGLLILAAAYFFCYLMHMMLAELAIGAGSQSQIISVFRRFLFKGKYGNIFLGIMFTLCTLIIITNLSAYIAGGAEVLESTGLSPLLAKLLIYAVAAGVALFGLKILGVSETVTIFGIIAIVLTLMMASLPHFNNPLPLKAEGSNALMAYFGMAMFALTAVFSVPQAVTGLHGDEKLVKKAITCGLGLNCGFIFIIVLCALAVSPEVTELAMIGWSAGIGLWAQVLGGIFTLLAILTTYWSLSLALSDIIQEQLHWNNKLCWLIATLPSFLIVFFDLGSFMELMRTASGLICILIAIMIVPAYRTCRKEAGTTLLSKTMGGTVMQVLMVLSFLLAAVGSTVSI